MHLKVVLVVVLVVESRIGVTVDAVAVNLPGDRGVQLLVGRDSFFHLFFVCKLLREFSASKHQISCFVEINFIRDVGRLRK